MKLVASCVSLVLVVGVLVGGAVALMACQFDFCDPLTPPQPSSSVVSTAGGPAPTLAPPQEEVLVQIQTDKPGLEVGWAN